MADCAIALVIARSVRIDGAGARCPDENEISSEKSFSCSAILEASVPCAMELLVVFAAG
jgi:hypothetical protein